MGLFKDAMRKGIPGRDAGATQARPTQQQQAPRPTLIQGGPAYFTPEGYRPPMQPQQAFMPTDTMGDPIGDMFRRQLPPVRGPSLPRLPPQKDPRDGQIFVPPPIDDPRMEPMPEPDPIDMPEPVFLGDPNQPITGGPAPTQLPQPPIPPMAPPMMPPSFERMDEPRDEFIPRMPNENPVPFIPPVEMPRDMPPIMPPSFERIEEYPRMPLEEPIAMPRNPEMVAEIQRRMAPPPMMPTQEPISPPYEMGVVKESPGLPEQDMSGKFTDISDNFVDTNPFLEDRGFGPGITRTPDFMDPGYVGQTAPLPPAQIEQIKQVLPQLPQEQLMEILPQLPPEAIQELPEELIRKIMPMMPEPMMPRMQMPGPIATPTPRSKRPSLPMMPMMGGRGRR